MLKIEIDVKTLDKLMLMHNVHVECYDGNDYTYGFIRGLEKAIKVLGVDKFYSNYNNMPDDTVVSGDDNVVMY